MKFCEPLHPPTSKMCLNKKQPQYIVLLINTIYYILWFLFVVQEKGFEPSRFYSLASETSASAIPPPLQLIILLYIIFLFFSTFCKQIIILNIVNSNDIKQ